MSKTLKIFAIIMIVSILFIGCSTNNNNQNTDSEKTTYSDEDKLIIIEYQRDNFIQFIENGKYQGADDYWNDNFEMHLDEESTKYYNYNCGMLNLQNGNFARALESFSENDMGFLDTQKQVDNIHKEIDKFNGVYSCELLPSTYLCINNGNADYMFDLSDKDKAKYYSKYLIKTKDSNDNTVYSISYDSNFDDTYYLSNISENGDSFTLTSKDNTDNSFNGVYKRIETNPPEIK